MNDNPTPWDVRFAALWTRLDTLPPDAFVAAIDGLADEALADDGNADFERASARDSTGRTADAVPLYRAALQRGLAGERRRRATIQLASSLRALGQADESVALLRAERERCSDALDDAVIAVLSLALVDTGRAKEAASLAIEALAHHLPRYQRSMANYARAIAID